MIRTILFMISTLLFMGCVTDAPYKLPAVSFNPEQLDDGWVVSSAEEQEMSRDLLTSIQEKLHDEDIFFNTKSLIIARNGELVFETYIQDPEDRSRIGHVQSMTKSVTSLITGIALQDGLIDSLNQPVVGLIPNIYPDNARKREITIRHLLTMRSGLDIDNSVFSVKMYVDKPENPARYILDLPLYADPGERFYYRDCDPHLMSYIIGELSGRSIEEIARERLFTPLGIEDYYWGSDHSGTSMGAHGLHAKPRDLLKIGQLVLQNGKWEGQQLVDSSWVSQATQTQVQTPDDYGWNYGYYWWMVPEWNGFSAWGHGGNFIMVLPDYGMVILMTSMPDTNDELVGSALNQLEDLIRPLMESLQAME